MKNSKSARHLRQAALTIDKFRYVVPLVLAMMFLPSVVRAQTELELTDGSGDTVIVNSSGAVVSSVGAVSGTSIASGGAVTWDGTLGNWNVNVTTGIGSPAEPAATLDLNSVDVSGSASGALDILLSQVGNTAAVSGFSTSFGGTLSSGTVESEFYASSSDGYFDTVGTSATIGTFDAGAFSGSGNLASPPATPYSLTEEIAINGAGLTTFSGDASLAPTPEPASLILFGTGLLVMVGLLRRKLLF